MGMKAGLAALWAKKQFGINYVVSEHGPDFEHAFEKFEHTICQIYFKMLEKY